MKGRREKKLVKSWRRSITGRRMPGKRGRRVFLMTQTMGEKGNEIAIKEGDLN